MSAIDIVSDANVALKWFHAAGEEEVEEARALLAGQRDRSVALCVLDLTAYEVGNALLRSRARERRAGRDRPRRPVGGLPCGRSDRE